MACFLCGKSLDGWEDDDNPIEEHLRHSPTCGWAIMAAIEAGLGHYGKVHPLDPVMMEARKATFAGRWPYESKRGFKCKTKKVSALLRWAGASMDHADRHGPEACRSRLEIHAVARRR